MKTKMTKEEFIERELDSFVETVSAANIKSIIVQVETDDRFIGSIEGKTSSLANSLSNILDQIIKHQTNEEE